MRRPARFVCFVLAAGVAGSVLAGCARTTPVVVAPDYAPPPVSRPDAKRDLEAPRRF